RNETEDVGAVDVDPGDSKPSISSAQLRPSEPVPGDTLVLHYVTGEPDGAALSAGFLWQLNGQRLGNDGPKLMVPAQARKGDTIKVRLVVQNGSETSDEIWREVTVGNTTEKWVSLELVPSGEVAAGTVLTAVSEVDDHDGDALEYEYTWSVNGTRQDATGGTFSTVGLTRDDEISVTVMASDGDSYENEMESNTVTILNSDPKITSAPPKFSRDGSLRYEVKVVDPDGDRRITYSLDAGPKSMKIDNISGILTWAPVEADVGEHQIEVRASDRYGGFALQHFDLTVGFESDDAVPASTE
ncbi:MAG: hypothetical protein JRG89_22460, partial [Deltaproteobacteria bacterium]|nr:hypothetical protein [Deltaproteobacteria bacterium]